MITKSLSLRELDQFEREFIGLRRHPFQIAIAPRRFRAMADVEALMWLQLGTELEIIRAPDATRVFEEYKERLIGSLKYVERTKTSRLFRGEVEILSERLANNGVVPFIERERHLDPQLFDSGLILMLFHEVGRLFRQGDLTMFLAFSSPGIFHRYIRQKCKPNTILQDKNLSGINLLIAQYLEFLNHAGGLEDLWEYFGSVCDSNYAVSELRRRVRCMHNWRLDLHDSDVRNRFDELTGVLVEGARSDAILSRVGFSTRDLLSQIEIICESWCGNGGSSLTNDASGGESSQLKGVKLGRGEDTSEKKRPAKAA